MTSMPARRPPGAHRRGNNLDSVRQHNLSVVLTLVHHTGATSRSLLTKRTGLNRSTIADLVGELVALDLVKEVGAASASAGRGRPSSMVCANENTVAITVNPEADAVTVGVVGLGGYVHNRIRYATERPPTAKEAVRIATAIIQGVQSNVGAKSRIIGIGVAVPGLVHHDSGLVRWAPRLRWVDEPISDLLTATTGLPVMVGNDASLGAIGESLFGSGRDVANLIYVNGGASGIGGGIICRGALIDGVDGYAGEFGHTRVGSSNVPDTAGLVGTLEAQVTRAALLRAVGLADADADELERALLADSRSPTVRREVQAQVEVLGVALASAINILNPQLIVLGGFLGTLYAVDGEHLKEVVARETLPQAWRSVRLSRGELGSNILMVGGAELAFSKLLNDPANGVKG